MIRKPRGVAAVTAAAAADKTAKVVARQMSYSLMRLDSFLCGIG